MQKLKKKEAIINQLKKGISVSGYAKDMLSYVKLNVQIPEKLSFIQIIK